MSFSDLSPENTISDPDTGIEANVVAESDGNKLLVRSSIVPEGLGDLFFIHATYNSAENMNVDGSTTTVIFSIDAESGVGAQDLVVQEMRFESIDSNVKIGNFLGINTALTNGVLVRVTSDGTPFDFLPIANTFHFETHFAFGPGGKSDIIFDSPNDGVSSTFSPTNPFVLRKDTSDKIEILIRDDLTTVVTLKLIAFGFKDDNGS